VLLQYFTPDEMTMLSARMDPTVPTDTLYYPLKEPGERFPINDPLLEPQLAPRPKEDHLFLQGMFEGIARIEKMCFDAIASRGGTFPNRVFTAGGGANNPVWTEIRARALKLPIGEMEQSEAAVGAAKIARMASA
jgi:sugar (pentulose or hexulose) kinase